MITAVAILTLLILQIKINNETPATPQQTYAIVLNNYGSFNLSIPLISILLFAARKATTPKLIITAK